MVDNDSLNVSVNDIKDSLDLNDLDMSNLGSKIISKPSDAINKPKQPDLIVLPEFLNTILPDDNNNNNSNGSQTNIYQFSSSALSWKGYIVVCILFLLALLFCYFIYKKLSN